MTMEAERDGEEQRRPLLSSSSPPAAASAAVHGSLSALRGGGGGWAGGGPEFCAAEESVATFSSPNYYPPAPEPHHDAVYPLYIPGDVLSPSPSPAPTPPHTHVSDRDVLDEVEIRNLLIDHVGHQCCWGSQPARTWEITSTNDCTVYVGTLETFIEERDSIIRKEPYHGGNIDGRDHGPVLGVWELDLRSEFPPLFVEKKVVVKIPHSDVPEKCSDCKGRGERPCPTCNTGHMTQCCECQGRGLVACQDGSDNESDTVCGICNGQGMVPCIACGARGILTCKTCDGCGSLLAHRCARVRWKILSARKVSVAAGAASVPEEVFHRAKGVQLCNIQAYQCTPAFFADSYPLNQFSSEVVASRLLVPPSARVISERHIISEVPVTRVTMSHRKRSFSFYVVGYSRDVFVRDYPSNFCWGLCFCFEWLWN
ncbi:uncharacterized protein [Lolium perenne]|uniref:uncharacterized protein isoform X2 n=1 Tax=Lolium perenne TaxID=4522 RepID=UPI0021F64B40|nr:uncharacterized protein LOC127294357 isoform X2 [Lolium perenne]